MRIKFQLGDILMKRRMLFNVILLLITGGTAVFLPGIRINQDFADYLPKADPDLSFYLDYSDKLGSEDDLIVLAVNNETGIFQHEFLESMKQFTHRLESLPAVINIADLLHLSRPAWVLGAGMVSIPMLRIDSPVSFTSDSLRIMKDPRLKNWLLSEDGKTYLILLFIQDGIDSKQADELISGIDNAASVLGIWEMHKAGRIYWEVTYNRLSNSELLKGIIISLAILCLAMIILYRSWKILLLALSIFLLAGINLFGYMSAIGRELNAMSNLIPVILLIVSISDLIHILEKYRQNLKPGASHPQKIRLTMNEVGLSVFLTSLTTSIGFLTLSLSSVLSLRNFGLDIALGIILTFFIAIILAPVFIKVLKIDAIYQDRRIEKIWRGICYWIYRRCRSGSLAIWTGMLLLLLLSLFGISKIDRNNRILSSMPLNHEITQDVQFFEKDLGGARTFEKAIIATVGSKLDDPEILREIGKVHSFLDSLEVYGPVLSTATLYGSIYSLLYPYSDQKLPQTEEQVSEIESILVHQDDIFSIALVDSTRTLGRITGKMKDPGRMEVGKINARVNQWIIANTDTSLVRFRSTGSMMMVDKLQESTIRNLLTGLLLAVGVIGLIISVLFRNFRMVIITMIANIMPVLAVAGLMPLLKIELRYGTSIIFAIGFVIAIDDTIHFMSNYRLHILNNYSNKASILLTLKKTGKAILITSMILFCAFISLVFSTFRDAYAVGALIAIMLIIALVIDLLAVPLLLKTNSRKIN
jgi:predicted RND superfamily exporter protein